MHGNSPAHLRHSGAAHVAVEIGLLEPETVHDHLNDTVRDYAGHVIDRRGAFAGSPHALRRGGFDDVDRETVTALSGGVPHVRATSHRGVCEFVAGAGLDA